MLLVCIPIEKSSVALIALNIIKSSSLLVPDIVKYVIIISIIGRDRFSVCPKLLYLLMIDRKDGRGFNEPASINQVYMPFSPLSTSFSSDCFYIDLGFGDFVLVLLFLHRSTVSEMGKFCCKMICIDVVTGII
ncbi:hypothetical protein L6452_00716 [Arctium lappa]|uniref:Uncharacterized protein n=1 Tax=Arctium lappa TaxID=4217 RepID=A0ACB9FEM4_ARCLA|nr:hypothetical protein L6452_00716 [Arctium lappa]